MLPSSAHDLISDILGKQHDFNNQMNAIRMLPYTYKDYDSLSDAIANYSTFLEEEFNESELLKINLPVVAGFVFSKIKEAEQKGCLFVVVEDGEKLVEYLSEQEIESVVIGVVTEKKEKLIVVNELEHRCLSPVNGDEIHKVL